MEQNDGEYLGQSTELRRFATTQRNRRYRAQAVLGLLLILGVAYVIVHSDSAVSAKLYSATLKRRTLDDALEIISPFAKKKVYSFKIVLMPSVKIYTLMKINVRLS
jgi:hypothetical protein